MWQRTMNSEVIQEPDIEFASIHVNNGISDGHLVH